MKDPTPEQIAEVMARVNAPDFDPTLKAVMQFVKNMCTLAMAESTGFYTGSTIAQKEREAVTIFVLEMEAAVTQTEG